MTIDGELLAVIDVEPSWCEDGKTLFTWYTLSDGRQALSTYTLGVAPGQAQTAPFIVEGV
jgi:hypothetical protein